ncbi:hypothetical protein EBX31_03695 [bacterium]|nr:hypothetical protein [bacterium]
MVRCADRGLDDFCDNGFGSGNSYWNQLLAELRQHRKWFAGWLDCKDWSNWERFRHFPGINKCDNRLVIIWRCI